MEKVIRVSKSFAESDRSDKDYYRSLSPLERLEILMELNRQWPTIEDAEAPQRVERVWRIVKFDAS